MSSTSSTHTNPCPLQRIWYNESRRSLTIVGDSVIVVFRGVAGSVVYSAIVGTKIMYIDTFSPLPSFLFMQYLVH